MSYLDLYDFRRRVFGMYRERNEALGRGDDPAAVCERFRQDRDRLFATHPQSALDEGRRRGFRGLDYFPYDPAAAVEATLDKDVEPGDLVVETGDGATRMVRAARARFSLDGRPLALTLYWIEVYGGGLFLPFRDATAPRETYGGGRYLFDTVKGSDFIVGPDRDGRPCILLDFNYAYNPSCAYSYRWSCPLAPPENDLQVAVRAGERAPR